MFARGCLCGCTRPGGVLAGSDASPCASTFLLPFGFSLGALRAACALGVFLVLFFLAHSLRWSFHCFRPWVLWASALCGCPPALSFVFFSRAPLVAAFPLFPALGALGLGALWLTAPRSFFFLPSPPPPPLFAGSRPAVPLALAPPGWVCFSSLGCGLSCSVCVVRCWCAPPTPPGRLHPVFCGVPRLVVRCRGMVWAVFCGSLCCLVFVCAVLCWCAGASLFGVLLCCVVGFVAGCLPLALAVPFLLL